MGVVAAGAAPSFGSVFGADVAVAVFAAFLSRSVDGVADGGGVALLGGSGFDRSVSADKLRFVGDVATGVDVATDVGLGLAVGVLDVAARVDVGVATDGAAFSAADDAEPWLPSDADDGLWLGRWPPWAVAVAAAPAAAARKAGAGVAVEAEAGVTVAAGVAATLGAVALTAAAGAVFVEEETDPTTVGVAAALACQLLSPGLGSAVLGVAAASCPPTRSEGVGVGVASWLVDAAAATLAPQPSRGAPDVSARHGLSAALLGGDAGAAATAVTVAAALHASLAAPTGRLLQRRSGVGVGVAAAATVVPNAAALQASLAGPGARSLHGRSAIGVGVLPAVTAGWAAAPETVGLACATTGVDVAATVAEPFGVGSTEEPVWADLAVWADPAVGSAGWADAVAGTIVTAPRLSTTAATAGTAALAGVGVAVAPVSRRG